MKIWLIILLFVFIGQLPAISQPVAYLNSYAIGETNVTIQSRKFGPTTAGVTFINVHDNEQTSVKAAENYLEACGGGTLVYLPNKQERFIEISLFNRKYRFDPNRIYSEEGRRNSLKKLSDTLNASVQEEVGYLATQILRAHLATSRLVVAIHNNTDSSLSILSYQQEQADKKHFGRVFINPEMDPDDFILTPDFAIFKKVRDRNINVVWENSKLIKDDGSLSVYAGTHKIPYINIEAEHEHFEEQLAMLNALDDIIKEYVQIKPIRNSAGISAAVKKTMVARAK